MTQKLAARAGVRLLRNLFNAGNLREAEALAQQGGKILTGRNLPRGSQLRILGSGSEGVAQHVLMPTGGTAVVKTYDPTSVAYNRHIQANRRELVGKDIPGFAKIHAMGQTPYNVQGRPGEYALMEYVPGKAPTDQAQVAALMQRSRTTPLPGGSTALDVRRANMIQDARTGQVKVVDYMPVKDALPAHMRPEGMDHHPYLHMQPHGETARGFVNDPQKSLLGKIMRAHDSQGALHPEHLMPRAGLSDQQMARYRRDMAAADKRYQGNLLNEAYGNKVRPLSSTRPAAVTARQEAPTAAARPAVTAHRDTPTVAAQPATAAAYQDTPTVAMGPAAASRQEAKTQLAMRPGNARL
jgi:hypothetical protein